jgi:hypothetical protein
MDFLTTLFVQQLVFYLAYSSGITCPKAKGQDGRVVPSRQRPPAHQQSSSQRPTASNQAHGPRPSSLSLFALGRDSCVAQCRMLWCLLLSSVSVCFYSIQNSTLRAAKVRRLHSGRWVVGALEPVVLQDLENHEIP